jgi:hypothetical protein
MRKALELLQVLYGGSVTNHIPYTRAVVKPHWEVVLKPKLIMVYTQPNRLVMYRNGHKLIDKPVTAANVVEEVAAAIKWEDRRGRKRAT